MENTKELSIADLEKADLNRPGRPPLCIDCQYISKSQIGNTQGHRCLSPNNYAGINLVDGYRVYKMEFCYNQRMTTKPLNMCGAEGAWFKQCEPLPPSPIINTKVSDIASRAKARISKVSASDLENL